MKFIIKRGSVEIAELSTAKRLGIEEGKAEDLLKKESIFAQMYKLQYER